MKNGPDRPEPFFVIRSLTALYSKVYVPLGT